MGLFDFLRETISLDFGTSYLRLVYKGQLVVKEPTRVIKDPAKKYYKYSTELAAQKDMQIMNPLHAGVIAEFEAYEFFLKECIRKIHVGQRIFKPSLVVVGLIPDKINQVESRAFKDSLEHAGSVEYWLVRSYKATQLGMGITGNDNYMLIDAGGGKISISVISENKLLYSHKLPYGAEQLKLLTAVYLEKVYDLVLNTEQTEQLFHREFSFDKTVHQKLIKVEGRDKSGVLKEVDVSLSEWNTHLDPYLRMITDEISNAIYLSPVKPTYIYITGGLAKQHGFVSSVEKSVPVTVIDKSHEDYTLKGLIQLDKEIREDKKNFDRHLIT